MELTVVMRPVEFARIVNAKYAAKADDVCLMLMDTETGKYITGEDQIGDFESVLHETLAEMATINHCVIQPLGGLVGMPNMPQYVISNEKMTEGASALFYPGAFRLAKNVIGTSRFYVLPSSVHEMILLEENEVELERYKAMVRDINKNMVMSQGCFLSDNVFVCDADRGTFEIA